MKATITNIISFLSHKYLTGDDDYAIDATIRHGGGTLCLFTVTRGDEEERRVAFFVERGTRCLWDNLAE